MALGWRPWASCVGLGAVLATAWPLALDPKTGDDFPLSTYPMFASKRGRSRLTKLVGIDAAGQRRSLPPSAVGTDEIMQAFSTLAIASRDAGKARRLCEDSARRVAAEPRWAEVVALEVVRAEYDPIEYFVGPAPRQAVTSVVRARCEVPRPPEGGR